MIIKKEGTPEFYGEGGLNFVVTGTTTSSMTTAVNTSSSTYCVESYTSCYSIAKQKYVSDDGELTAVSQGGAVMSTVSRDCDNTDYVYEHSANRWAVPNVSLVSSTNMTEDAFYSVTQLD